MRYGLNRIAWTWKLVEQIGQLRAEGLSWSQIADEHFPHITCRSLCDGYHQARREVQAPKTEAVREFAERTGAPVIDTPLVSPNEEDTRGLATPATI